MWMLPLVWRSDPLPGLWDAQVSSQTTISRCSLPDSARDVLPVELSDVLLVHIQLFRHPHARHARTIYDSVSSWAYRLHMRTTSRLWLVLMFICSRYKPLLNRVNQQPRHNSAQTDQLYYWQSEYNNALHRGINCFHSVKYAPHREKVWNKIGRQIVIYPGLSSQYSDYDTDWTNRVPFAAAAGIILVTREIPLWGPPSLLSNGSRGLIPRE
jgi:hypothetical protein